MSVDKARCPGKDVRSPFRRAVNLPVSNFLRIARRNVGTDHIWWPLFALETDWPCESDPGRRLSRFNGWAAQSNAPQAGNVRAINELKLHRSIRRLNRRAVRDCSVLSSQRTHDLLRYADRLDAHAVCDELSKLSRIRL